MSSSHSLPNARPAVDATAGSTVRPGCHLTLNYRVSLADLGTDVVSTFGQRPATIQLGLGQLGEALELRLLGMREGERRVFELAAGEAYGERNPQLLQRFSRRLLDESSAPGTEYACGDLLEFPRPDGGRLAGVLKAIDAESALVDFNHPLAGKTVVFEAEILGILE